MAYRRQRPAEPTRRLPWVVLALGLLVLAVVGAFYLLNRPRTVNLTVEPSPTPNPLAGAQTVQAGPPPTFTPPPAIVQPTVTPPPTPTRVPVAASPSGFVPGPATRPAATPPPAAAPPAAPPPPNAAPVAAPSAAPPAAAAPGAPPGPAAAPTEPGSSTALPGPGQPPGAPPGQAAAAPTPTQPPPTPTPFAGQVSAAGGAGNTRQDLDSAYGAPTGQTPDLLVAYRKGTTEYHVGYTPDPARAWLIEELVPQGTPMTFEQAMAEARKLFPRDTQPRGGQPEGNNQFVVERFRSPTLGEAIPPEQFQQRGGNPGDFLAVYARDPAQAGRIARIIVGIGDNPNVLLAAR